jgi:hypothetical protein
MGHIISAGGLQPSDEKVDAVRNFPTPSDANILRSFLGLASFYRRFFPDFAAIADPLHHLLRKGQPCVIIDRGLVYHVSILT